VTNPNPLSEHAHPTMVRIWSADVAISLERAWWVSVMEAQRAQGLDIPQEAIEASRAQVAPSPFWSQRQRLHQRINERERITRHDVKARLEVFCEDAGHEYHHLGLTSADVVENTLQIKVRDSLEHLKIAHGIDVSHLWGVEPEYVEVGMSDSPHHERVVSQAGSDCYVLRGIHGAIGTDQDQLDLLGSADKIHMLNAWLCQRWAFPDYARTVPQVMHRSQDLAVLTPVVSQVTHRLFSTDQPELLAKARLWRACINGYLSMISAYAGDTWNEGDVSSSVVRRVAIPNLLLAVSSALVTTGA
jgi:adenylosuccinate lyase